MDILGIMLIGLGLILMVASKGIYRKGLKSAKKLTDNHKEVEEYMMLVGSGMIAIRVIALIMMLIGVGLFIGGLILNQ